MNEFERFLESQKPALNGLGLNPKFKQCLRELSQFFKKVPNNFLSDFDFNLLASLSNAGAYENNEAEIKIELNDCLANCNAQEAGNYRFNDLIS